MVLSKIRTLYIRDVGRLYGNLNVMNVASEACSTSSSLVFTVNYTVMVCDLTEVGEWRFMRSFCICRSLAYNCLRCIMY